MLGKTINGSFLKLLVQGKPAAFAAQAAVLMAAFAKKLGVKASSSASNGRVHSFLVSCPDIALRGFGGDQLGCFIVAEENSDQLAKGSRIWSRITEPSEFQLVLCCSHSSYESMNRKLGQYYVLILSPIDVQKLLESTNAVSALKLLIRERFPASRIHPFYPQRPVYDAHFRGRHDFLTRFKENPTISFALIGPSKMGKTSLVKQYLREMSNEPGLGATRIYIDLFDRPVSDAELARIIRMKIDPGSDSYYQPAGNLPEFFAKVKSRHKGPIDIILDESDKHLRLETMQTLLRLAEKDYCRIILVGRWRLMKLAIHTEEDGFSRLEEALLDPLSNEDGLSLVEQPLVDMNLHVSQQKHELRSAINRLGGVPGLLQEFGSFLVQECRGQIDSRVIKKAIDRVVNTSRMNGLLKDLSSPLARAAALALTLETHDSPDVEPIWFKDWLAQKDLDVSIMDCIEVFDELVIHHLVLRVSGDYRLSRWDLIAGKSRQELRYKIYLDEQLKAIEKYGGSD